VEAVDVQVHIWDADSPAYPWQPDFARRAGIAGATGNKHIAGEPVTVDRMLQAMDAADVDAAIIVSPALYGFDARYALAAARAHPQRFRVVGYVDHEAPDVAERVQAWAAQPHAAGLRIILMTDAAWEAVAAGAYDAFLRAAAKAGQPVCFFAARHMHRVPELLRRVPDVPLIIDHVGLLQPPMEIDPATRFAALPHLLALARNPNLSVKLSGLPTLSLDPWPYADVRPIMHQVIAAFGVDRVMWGSDWTRCPPRFTWRDAVRFIREPDDLSVADKEKLLAGNLRRIYGWPRA
jgi:predicted TIM-barrel fold metal-dependent hydrolase